MTNPIVVGITDELLAELEQLAGNATPGPWAAYGLVIRDIDGSEDQIAQVMDWKDDESKSNAEYIARANPATILALIQHVRELKRDAARYRWLRNPDQDVALVLDKMTGSGVYEYRAGEELDAAIDSAMTTKPD